MALRLSTETEERIDHLVQRGDFQSADDVVRYALALLDEVAREGLLEAALTAAQDDMIQGNVSEMTPELLERINAVAADLHRRGIQPNPDVLP